MSSSSERSTVGPLESFRTIRTLTEKGQVTGVEGDGPGERYSESADTSRSSMLSDAEAPRLDLIRRRHHKTLKTSTASIIFYAGSALRWERKLRDAARGRGERRRRARAAARWNYYYFRWRVDVAFRQQRMYVDRRRSDHRKRKRRHGKSAMSSRREHKETVIAVLQYVDVRSVQKNESGTRPEDLQRMAIADCFFKMEPTEPAQENAATGSRSEAGEGSGSGKRLVGWFLFESFERSHFIVMEVYMYRNNKELFRQQRLFEMTPAVSSAGADDGSAADGGQGKGSGRGVAGSFFSLRSAGRLVSKTLSALGSNPRTAADTGADTDISTAFVDSDDRVQLTMARLASGSQEYPSDESSSARTAPSPAYAVDTVWLSPMYDLWPLSSTYWMEDSVDTHLPSSSPSTSLSPSSSATDMASSPSSSMTQNSGEVKAFFKFLHCIQEHEPAFLEATERMIRSVHKQLKGQILLSLSKQLTITTTRERLDGRKSTRGAKATCTRFLLIAIHMTPLSLALHKKLPGHRLWYVDPPFPISSRPFRPS